MTKSLKPPASTLPQRKSGLPDLRKKMRTPGKPGVRGGGRIEADLLSRFAAIVGEKYAITDPAEQEGYLIEGRGLYRGRTPMVLRPGSTAEVAAILTLANDTGTPVVPQGGNTGLVGGQVPHETGNEIVLSLTRLDRIREVDATSNTMTCEAGVVLAKAQEAAEAAARLFPLSLGAGGQHFLHRLRQPFGCLRR